MRQWLGRKTRQEERSEEAAQDLVALLDDARKPFLDAYQLDSKVDRGQVRDATSKLRQKALLLSDQSARTRIELVAEVLEDYFGAREFTGDAPSRIAWVAWSEGREAVRRLLVGEALESLSDDLARYKESMEEKRQLYEEYMKEEAERRQQERERRDNE